MKEIIYILAGVSMLLGGLQIMPYDRATFVLVICIFLLLTNTLLK